MGNRCQSNKQTNKRLLVLSLVGWQRYEETVEPFKRCALEGGSFIMVDMPPMKLWDPDKLPISYFVSQESGPMCDYILTHEL